MFKLYPYQIQITSIIENDLHQPGNSLVIMPTGSGKSLIVAEIARWINQPILILQPNREILNQNREKLEAVVGKDDIGIFSASVNSQTIKTYTLATIGSIYKKPELFKEFRLVLLDEAHLLAPKKLNTMYRSFFNAIGSPKVIGLTATPYRMESWGEKTENGWFINHTTTKLINRHYNPFWNRILVSVGINDLIEAGYLRSLKYINKELIPVDEIPINTSHTDYNLPFFERKIADKQTEILATINYAQNYSKHVLVFCASVNQAKTLSEKIPGSGVVTAQTPKKERKQIINDFKSGVIKTVFNVDCLTTGFDLPELDAIVVLRPTQSIRVHVQMLGRGVRIADGKKNCRVFDLVGNVKKLGPVESVRVKKIDGAWELLTATGSWHGKELYNYVVKR